MLTTRVDVVAGTAGDDAITAADAFLGLKDDGTVINGQTVTAFDVIDGGAGNDTLNVYSATAIADPVGTTIKNVETVNLTNAGGIVATATGWTGLTALNTTSSGGAVTIVAPAATNVKATTSAVTTSAVSVTGGANVTVSSTGVTTGTTTVGSALLPATGAVAVTVSGAATGITTGLITVNGGSTVTVTSKATNATVATTGTQSNVAVNGSAATTSVVVKQDAGVTAAAGVAGVTSGTVTIVDAVDALVPDSITSVTLANYGNSTVASSSVTDLTVSGGTTVVAPAVSTLASGTLALNVQQATVGVPTATALTIHGAGGEVGAISGTQFDKYTSITVDSTAATTIAALTAAATKGAATLNFTGVADTTLTAYTLDKLTAVNVTGAGGVTIGVPLAVTTAFSGGAGKDSVSVATAYASAISMGDGDDTVTYGGPAAAGGSIAGGAGIDTIKMTAAIAATATATATFATKVTGFEALEMTAATGAATALNMANAGGINTVVSNGVTTGALTVTNAAAGFTFKEKAATAVASSIALASTAGADDTVNFQYVSAANGFADTAATTVNGVENIVITTSAALVNTTGFTALVSGDAIKTVTISGTAPATLTNTDTTITSVDASGLMGYLSGAPLVPVGLTWTSGALASAATVKGSALGNNTVTFSAATKAVNYTGGAGKDVITASNTKDNIISLLGGDNQLTAGNGNNTVTLNSDTAVAVAGGATGNSITLGNGNNTVTDTGTKGAYVIVGTGANTITLGSGNDIAVVGAAAGVNTIDISSGGNDLVAIGGIQTAAGYYTTITGFGKGDTLDVSALTTTASAVTPLGAKMNAMGANATFANYLDAAAATDLSAASALTPSLIKWFQFGGDTYIVVDNALVSSGNTIDTTTFQDGVDSVIRLTGLIDLSVSTVATDLITYVATA